MQDGPNHDRNKISEARLFRLGHGVKKCKRDRNSISNLQMRMPSDMKRRYVPHVPTCTPGRPLTGKLRCSRIKGRT
jgi:hypothetical protein